MHARVWLWVGTVLDLALFVPGAYMAVAALSLYQQSDGSGDILGVLFLFFALPVFCIAAPMAAWQAQLRGRSQWHLAALLLAPVLYAAFLVVFLTQGS